MDGTIKSFVKKLFKNTKNTEEEKETGEPVRDKTLSNQSHNRTETQLIAKTECNERDNLMIMIIMQIQKRIDSKQGIDKNLHSGLWLRYPVSFR